MIELTCAEIRRLLTSLVVIEPARAPWLARSPRRTGGDATNTVLEPASTTVNKRQLMVITIYRWY
jgi:hypothetical protein